MPGSASDSYDPEFGTGELAAVVQGAVEAVRDRIAKHIGSPERPIVDVCEGNCGWAKNVRFTEQELRILRFALNRALESL